MNSLHEQTGHARTGGHPNKTCPRCGRAFLCQAKAVESCGCMQVTLDSQTRERIRADYADCLCPHCLRELNDGTAT